MRISFLGDTMCEPLLLNASKKSDGTYDFSETFAFLSNLLAESDYVICNLETPLAGAEAGFTDSLFEFNAPDEFAKALKDAGIDMVLTANNHCFDRGIDGALRTITAIDNLGLARAGSYLASEKDEYTVVELGNKRIAVVAATYGSNYHQNKVSLPDDSPIKIPFLRNPIGRVDASSSARKSLIKKAIIKIIPQEKRIAIKRKLGLNYYVAYRDDFFDSESVSFYLAHVHEVIEQAKKDADYVIFCPHVGGQFNREPGAFTSMLIEVAKEWHCSAIVASHPHVVQKAEMLETIPCFFSLGNLAMSPSSVYILPQNKPEYGIVAHLDFSDIGECLASYSVTKSCEDARGMLIVKPVNELYNELDEVAKKNLLADVLEIVGIVGSEKPVDSIQSEYQIKGRQEKASIIVPAYNAQDYIAGTLTSLINQSWNEIEIIVVNDGSSDCTESIIKEFAAKDHRVILVNQDHTGVSAARNRGLEAAQGEYVFFCDSDDWIEKEAIESMIRFAHSTDSDVVTADHYVDIDGHSIHKSIFPHSFVADDKKTIGKMQEQILYLQPTKINDTAFASCNGLGGATWHHLIKSSLLQEHDIRFDSSLDGLLEDGMFMMTVFEHVKRISYLNKALYHYRSDANSLTHGYLPDFHERCNKALSAFEIYGKHYRQDKAFFAANGARAFYFAKKLCDVDFMHPNNLKPEHQRYQEFVDLMKSRFFDTALGNLCPAVFLSRMDRIQSELLTKGQFRQFWWMRKAKRLFDKLKR